jgi:hypothetical protein
MLVHYVLRSNSVAGIGSVPFDAHKESRFQFDSFG